MKKENFKRNLDQLQKRATLYWPAELSGKEQSASIIPKLLATQDKFISILHVSDRQPASWKNIIGSTTEISANVFLKHLMVLADVGGEPLQRLGAQFKNIFPKQEMHFLWKEKPFKYVFQQAHLVSRITNKALHVDGKDLHKQFKLEPLMEDVIMLLLFGSTALGSEVPDLIKEKCIIGTMSGEKQELEKFVKQRYILVSRITGGATSNTLGQIAQNYVKDILDDNLPGWMITRNGTIPGISHNAGITDISFDIVVQSPKKKWFAVEVSFQFTTNSVIERKAGQAEARLRLVHKKGYKIAYVLDGAGNFARKSGLTTICKNSDCTVAFTPEEFMVLTRFLKENDR